MTRLEALLGAFARLNGALDPASDSYKLRNPLMLKAFSPKHERNEKGFRIFTTFPGGWDNGLLDLKIKCSGDSRAHLTSESTLIQLVETFGNTAAATRKVKNFLRVALNDDLIRESQKLGWFLEDVK